MFLFCVKFVFHYWCFRMQIIVLKANYFLESDNMFPINGFKTLAWSHHFTTSGYLDTLASLTLPHLLKCLCAYLCSTHSVLCFVLFLFFLCILSCQFLWMICFWLPLLYSMTFICMLGVHVSVLYLFLRFSCWILELSPMVWWCRIK